ncbi:hypothetical protein QRD02_06675 [Aequorivita sp. SDUM287046]|uniref:Lycopene cyclase domain-containing protein n=1 Tax=Aequorivita aurantiaca TaxID=3053356 RepID=A0ABT8DFF2_9FLAO|nr:hypothetical protein [Aequorivita aurantiaca]MDN3724061.1 hypothetical protein [Aequorivita aurantiaca]
MGFNDFLLYILPIYILEVLAALAGTYYLKKTSSPFKNTKYLVQFLWLTVFVETVGLYSPGAYFSNYELFSFVKDTPFAENYWWYNIYILVSYTFYIFYFISFVRKDYWKTIFGVAVGIFLLSSTLIFIFTDIFFKGYSPYVSIAGTILLFFSIVLFYFELLRSDLILALKWSLPFYISVGVLMFNLCLTPVELFIQYYNLKEGNELFVTLRSNVLLYGNIFMYSIYTLGFLVCSKKKKSSY